MAAAFTEVAVHGLIGAGAEVGGPHPRPFPGDSYRLPIQVKVVEVYTSHLRYAEPAVDEPADDCFVAAVDEPLTLQAATSAASSSSVRIGTRPCSPRGRPVIVVALVNCGSVDPTGGLVRHRFCCRNASDDTKLRVTNVVITRLLR